MKVVLAVCIAYVISLANCGLISSASLIQTPGAIVKSERIGDSFAYSTIEGAYSALPAPVALSYSAQVPVTYAAAPLTVPQPFYSPSIFQSFFNPGNPLYGGLVFQTPVGGQAPSPIFGQFPVAGQVPVQGQPPVQDQAPVQGQPPVQSPVVQPAPAAPQGDAPVQGAVVDDDTVSVESA